MLHCGLPCHAEVQVHDYFSGAIAMELVGLLGAVVVHAMYSSSKADRTFVQASRHCVVNPFQFAICMCHACAGGGGGMSWGVVKPSALLLPEQTAHVAHPVNTHIPS